MRLNVDAGWSSPVARQAHNLKVVGSNPTPATNTGSQKQASSDPSKYQTPTNLPQIESETPTKKVDGRFVLVNRNKSLLCVK